MPDKKKRKKRKRKQPSKVRYTSEQIDKSLGNERLRLTIYTILSVFIGAGLFMLMLTPFAKAIAGTNTNFDVTISLAINVALAVSTTAGGAGCLLLNRRRQHHYKRARELERRLHP